MNAVIEVTTETLKKGNDVVLTGFGAFCVVDRCARTGKNFQTGKAIEIPASKGVKFKIGKNLRDAVN